MNRSCYLLSHLHYLFKIVQLNCMRVYKNRNVTMTVLLMICLFLYCKNLKKTKGCIWRMMTRMIKLITFYTETKSKDGSATDEPLLLASQKSEENQGWHLGNDNENNEINESLCLTSTAHVCFYFKGFYYCNEDHCGMCMIFSVVISLVCFIIYYKSFQYYNEDHN